MFNRANGTAASLSDGFIPGTENHQISAMFRFKDNAADKMSKGARTGWQASAAPAVCGATVCVW
ncbi:MAG: hypothetical protein J1D88_04710 [Treponema sp.]|nr:hypothetical protein [Treponema sp.]